MFLGVERSRGEVGDDASEVFNCEELVDEEVDMVW